jgi:hypothetical protein
MKQPVKVRPNSRFSISGFVGARPVNPRGDRYVHSHSWPGQAAHRHCAGGQVQSLQRQIAGGQRQGRPVPRHLQARWLALRAGEDEADRGIQVGEPPIARMRWSLDFGVCSQADRKPAATPSRRLSSRARHRDARSSRGSPRRSANGQCWRLPRHRSRCVSTASRTGKSDRWRDARVPRKARIPLNAPEYVSQSQSGSRGVDPGRRRWTFARVDGTRQ